MPTDRARRTLILHIGHHKTGSTTIQDAFATGRVRIEGRSILYPTILQHNYLRPHFDAFARSGTILPAIPGRPGLAEISQEMAKGEYDYALISSENFEGADAGGVQRVLEKFFLPHVGAHAVICYLRPHAGRTLSHFAEDVKIGTFTGTPAEYHRQALRAGRFRYARRMAPWADAFGARLQVRPLVRGELAGGSALRDFVVTAFGAEARVHLDEGPAANESLCLEDLMVLRLVQESFATRGRRLRHALGWELARAFGAEIRDGQPGTRLALDRALAERIRTDYRADAVAADARFFAGRPVLSDELDRAVDEALPKAQSFDPADHFSADARRGLRVMAASLDAMLDNETGDWPEFLMQRRVAAVHGHPVGERRLPPSETGPVATDQGRTPAPRTAPASSSIGAVPDRVEPRADAAADAEPKKKAVTMAVVDRLVASATDAAGVDQLARRLGNILLEVPRHEVALTANQLVRRLDNPALAPDIGVELEEFLRSLFFHHYAADLAGPLRNATFGELAARPGGLGAAYSRLQFSSSPVPALTKAGIHYVRGDFAAAYDAFDLARRALLSDGTQRQHNRGVLSLRPLPVFAEWADSPAEPALPALTFASDRRFDTDLPIVVVSMDGGYYQRYAQRLAETAVGRANLHFHVANPGGVPLLQAPHLRHSVEEAPGANNAYFATMRFLRLAELLSHYGRPLMTSDADAYFVGSPQPVFDLARNFDVLMTGTEDMKARRASLAGSPWRIVSAQIFVAGPDDAAFDFLTVYRRLFAGLTAGGVAPHWWVDQALLAATADLFRHQGRAARIEKQWLFRQSGIKQGKL